MDMQEFNILLDNVELYFYESGAYYDTDYERYIEIAAARIEEQCNCSLLELSF